MRTSATADPFGTESIRARVLDAWQATPARFREDANTEQDYALDGYRDRTIVELLQNASDAALDATGAGSNAGKVQIELNNSHLIVSNTGSPLTAEGVASLASLRASNKRDQAEVVGRFGVGFAAVLAVSDEPSVRSTSGGVRFSRDLTQTSVGAIESLQDELTRRGRHVPVLRLPFETAERPVDGYQTSVVLPLRHGEMFDALAVELNELDDPLMLALPGVAELRIEIKGQVRTLLVERQPPVVEVTEASRRTRWLTHVTAVPVSATTMAERPVEERGRTTARVEWALPVTDDGRPKPLPASVKERIHAPTVTDEPLALPAVLIGDFPLDPSRRHIARGELANHLLGAAASSYADLVTELAARVGVAALTLVPEPGFFGELDAHLRKTIRTELRTRPLLQAASDEGRMLTGAQGVIIEGNDEQLVQVLAQQVDGVVAAEWGRVASVGQLVEAQQLSIGDVLDMLIEARQPPRWWHELFGALSNFDMNVLDGLPVLLADESLTRDIRSTVLASNVPEILATLGLRVVHPDAVHPLLGKLGAASGDIGELLTHPAVKQRITETVYDDEMVDVAFAVLTLVGDIADGDALEGLGDLKLPCIDGQYRAARECVVPDSPLSRLLATDDEVIDVAQLGSFSFESLARIGAMTELSCRRLNDVLFDSDVLAATLPDGESWFGDVCEFLDSAPEVGGLIPELTVVGGLTLIADDAWPRAWPLLVPSDIRRAIVEPVDVVVAGRRHRVQSPTAWWLSEAPLFAPASPKQVRLPGDSRLNGLLPEVNVEHVDPELLAALGVRSSLDDWIAQPFGADELLARMADEECVLAADQLAPLYRALVSLPEARWPDSPEVLRVIDAAGTKTVAAEHVTVVTAPHHHALVVGPAIAGSERLAELLEVRTSAELAAGLTVPSGVTRPVPDSVGGVLSESPIEYREHDDLVIANHHVQWWVDEDGVVHAATTDGLARGLAWSSGQWGLRWELAAVLADPTLTADAQYEREFD